MADERYNITKSEAQKALRLDAWGTLRLASGAEILCYPDPDGGGMGDEYKLSPFPQDVDRGAIYIMRDDLREIAG